LLYLSHCFYGFHTVARGYHIRSYGQITFLVPFGFFQVKRTFFSIVVVFLGGALWGCSELLIYSFVAILKIIFDRLPEMEQDCWVIMCLQGKGEIMEPTHSRKRRAYSENAETEEERL
jgi:hypothetical protein